MSKELLRRALDALRDENVPNSITNAILIKDIEAELAKPEPEPFEIEWPEYHCEGMGCGLEDRCINDRYEAMRYGWDCALDRVGEELPEQIYTIPPNHLVRIVELESENEALRKEMLTPQIMQCFMSISVKCITRHSTRRPEALCLRSSFSWARVNFALGMADASPTSCPAFQSPMFAPKKKCSGGTGCVSEGCSLRSSSAASYLHTSRPSCQHSRAIVAGLS